MIAAYQAQCQRRVDAALDSLFQPPQADLTLLYQAMRYSVINGGKRVRPLLVYAACEALGGEVEQADGAANDAKHGGDGATFAFAHGIANGAASNGPHGRPCT